MGEEKPMKKWRNIAGCLLVALVLAGCGGGKAGGTANGTGQKQTVEQTVQDQIAQQDAQNQVTNGNNAGHDAAEPVVAGSAAAPVAAGSAANNQGASVQPDQAAEGQSGIDVDLTALSSTMVYSEVYNMMMTPEDYIGKVVKMNGLFSVYHDEAQDINYYACVIQDATACCSQGMEFVLTDKYTYPDDYPEQGGEVTVVGTFDTYKEGEYTYCTLRNAELVN